MRSSGLDNANTRTRPPSEVIAHYLEAIYYIRAEGEAVRSARLADWLEDYSLGQLWEKNEFAGRPTPE